MRRALAFSIVLKAALSASGAGAETLKVAVAQRGFWNSSFIEFGITQGFFKEAGLDIDILYTEGGASTLTPVIAGSIDIAMTNGTLGVIAAYAKGMPVKIISAEATGAADVFWYARPESGIKGLADAAGKTVAFSSPGSSSNLVLLQLIQQAKAAAKLIPTGGAPATLTLTLSPGKAARALLNSDHSLDLSILVSYTPTGGTYLLKVATADTRFLYGNSTNITASGSS